MSTILIVDDHASLRRQARTLLEASGHEIVGEAADGRSAIELADTLRPEVVLLDIGLPDLDGFEVARQLATSTSGLPGAPPTVILMSSRDVAAYGPRIAASPVAGFIAKDELSGTTVAALIEGTRQG